MLEDKQYLTMLQENFNSCVNAAAQMGAVYALEHPELQQELNYLKTTRSDEVAEMIKVARGFGDLSENSEYDEAKNEQAKIEARIVETEIREHNFYETDSGEECIWCGITFEDYWDDEDFDTENCTCICHRFDHSMSEDFFTGALKVTIMEIIRIFWKLFKTNEICECGMHHY